jgi:UDP-MurNAc hydroxylase
MNIKLVSHASVIISFTDCCIWTDPWLLGTAFNNSWSLYPSPKIDEKDYEQIDYIWISHEHPDHFHIPTLKHLEDSFKKKITVLYQKNNSDKMIDAFKKMGFSKFIILPHRCLTKLTKDTSVYCYQVGNMDSVLGVVGNDELLLNINDAEMDSNDCKIVLQDLGSPDVVLNQFSIAGYSGHEDREHRLLNYAKTILDNCSNNHIDLKAKSTIPFASFVYFCQDDNCYINRYMNTPLTFAEHMNKKGLEYVILYPGEFYTTEYLHDNTHSQQQFIQAYANLDSKISILKEPSKTIEEIENAFQKRFLQIQEDYHVFFRKILKPVIVKIPDLKKYVIFSLSTGQFNTLEHDENLECDLTINSQPLWFAFTFPFGLQTLGVSARYILHKNEDNWKKYRILFAMNNAEVYLSRKFFNRSNSKWIFERFSGLLFQVIYQLKRM